MLPRKRPRNNAATVAKKRAGNDETNVNIWLASWIAGNPFRQNKEEKRKKIGYDDFIKQMGIFGRTTDAMSSKQHAILKICPWFYILHGDLRESQQYNPSYVNDSGIVSAQSTSTAETIFNAMCNDDDHQERNASASTAFASTASASIASASIASESNASVNNAFESNAFESNASESIASNASTCDASDDIHESDERNLYSPIPESPEHFDVPEMPPNMCIDHDNADTGNTRSISENHRKAFKESLPKPRSNGKSASRPTGMNAVFLDLQDRKIEERQQKLAESNKVEVLKLELEKEKWDFERDFRADTLSWKKEK
uniref:No apical meristem-associated C-terminal domain-containing protein n=1 Tax=Strigamia maritima TaxID=126957 RepID=T1IKD5_STRMM